MKAKRTLPVWAMALVVVVALAAMGVTYTLWTETLVVNGTVNTGEVDVQFTDPIGVVQGVDVEGIFTDYTDAIWDDPDGYLGLDTASCTAVPSSSGTEAGDGYNVITVTVNGAYPSYHCKVTFAVENIGTVPVALMSVSDIPTWVQQTAGCTIDAVELSAGEQTDDCTLDIHIPTDDTTVVEGEVVTFQWSAIAHQWNQSPSAGG